MQGEIQKIKGVLCVLFYSLRIFNLKIFEKFCDSQIKEKFNLQSFFYFVCCINVFKDVRTNLKCIADKFFFIIFNQKVKIVLLLNSKISIV